MPKKTGTDEKGGAREEIGPDFEATRERIRQIEAEALKRLSRPSRPKRRRALVEN